tara:strand:- start:983 stop:1729 length:747 start_codon:yes stop_codon:yes gene_type:complete
MTIKRGSYLSNPAVAFSAAAVFAVVACTAPVAAVAYSYTKPNAVISFAAPGVLFEYATVSEGLTYDLDTVYVDVVTASDGVVISADLAFTEAVTVSESIDTFYLDDGVTPLWISTASDNVTISDTTAFQYNYLRALGDTATITEALTINISSVIADSLSGVTEDLQTGTDYIEGLSDSVTMTSGNDSAAFAFDTAVGVGLINGVGAINQVVINSGSLTSGTGDDTLFTTQLFQDKVMNGLQLNGSSIN